MNGKLNRRVFTGSLIGAGAALATGSRLIRPVRAQSPDADNILINAVAKYMTDFQACLQNGCPPSWLDWHQFAGAAMALRATERAYGMNSVMESLYGQDEVATWAVDWAYQEGSWDAFESLVSLPYIFALDEFTADFDQRQSLQLSTTWINGTGPMSSTIPDCAGWAHCPPYPDTFNPPTEEEVQLLSRMRNPDIDDFTRETIGGEPPPWYSITSPWIPKVPAVNGFTIWVHNFPKVNKCNTAKWTVYLLTGSILFADLLGFKQRFPKYEAAARAVAWIMGGVTLWFCGTPIFGPTLLNERKDG